MYSGYRKEAVSIETVLFPMRLAGLVPALFWTRLSTSKFADRRKGRAVSNPSIRPEGLIGDEGMISHAAPSDQALTSNSSRVSRAACYARLVVAGGSLHHKALVLARVSTRSPTSG